MVSSDTEENKDEEEINVDDITLIHNDNSDSSIGFSIVTNGDTHKIIKAHNTKMTRMKKRSMFMIQLQYITIV